MYPERPGVTSLVSIPAYWARSVLPKDVFMPSFARTRLSRTVKSRFIPKYIRKARTRYSTLMLSIVWYSEPIPTYHNSAPKIATMSTTWRRTFRILLDDF